MGKMREEFSKHCQLWRYSEEVDENDFFVNATTQRAWDVWVTAWQASRAAFAVKLPQMPYYDFNSLKIEYALDEAGVKYEWVKK